MARYIEVDELKAKINANAWSNPVVPIYVNKVIDRTPTADVAPRSEVAREIFAEIEANINALEYNARTPRKTVSVDELKAQMDWVLREVIPGTLAKIKQKYTEEQK